MNWHNVAILWVALCGYVAFMAIISSLIFDVPRWFYWVAGAFLVFFLTLMTLLVGGAI